MGSQLRTGAMNAAALFANLRAERKVKMKRQQKDEDQDRRADETARSFLCPHRRSEHGSEVNQCHI